MIVVRLGAVRHHQSLSTSMSAALASGAVSFTYGEPKREMKKESGRFVSTVLPIQGFPREISRPPTPTTGWACCKQLGGNRATMGRP